MSWLRRRRVRVGEAVAVVGGALLLTASWVVVAVAGHVPRWEARVFGDVNDLPDWLWQLVRVPMQLGSFLGSLLVVAATLESVFAICIGCQAFALLMRAGVVPETVCVECADISRRVARA